MSPPHLLKMSDQPRQARHFRVDLGLLALRLAAIFVMYDAYYGIVLTFHHNVQPILHTLQVFSILFFFIGTIVMLIGWPVRIVSVVLSVWMIVNLYIFSPWPTAPAFAYAQILLFIS